MTKEEAIRAMLDGAVITIPGTEHFAVYTLDRFWRRRKKGDTPFDVNELPKDGMVKVEEEVPENPVGTPVEPGPIE